MTASMTVDGHTVEIELEALATGALSVSLTFDGEARGLMIAVSPEAVRELLAKASS